MRYEIDEDTENDCLTVTDKLGELTNSFGSEQLMLHPVEDAEPIIERLQFLECYVKELEMHLGYYDWTEDNFRDVKEEVELNME